MTLARISIQRMPTQVCHAMQEACYCTHQVLHQMTAGSMTANPAITLCFADTLLLCAY